MNFHVLTLFPEMIENGMNTSITGRAITKGLLTLEAVNIRDYAFNKHQKVDDYTYGGGARNGESLIPNTTGLQEPTIRYSAYILTGRVK